MKRIMLVLFYLLSMSICDDISYSGDNVYPDIVARVERVYDGDTIFVDIPNIPEAFGNELGIRIHSIDTPEIKGKCDKEKQLAQDAKQFVENLIKKDQFIVLKNVTRDKYFRLEADIYFTDGTNLSDLLIKSNLAYPYDGKLKRSWCD